ncbi:MAG: TRAP transporter large permease subunit [Alphaproteobacteria bacterium]|nr:TRAP transporter large permease subunit [Alphaproteobacteria bacterium]
MDLIFLGAVLLVVMLVLLGSGVWVAFSLIGLSWFALEFFTSAPVGKVLPTSVWGMVANWPLTALPLFIWMGEILFRTRLAEDMFRALEPWLVRLPGRHLHINVLSCGIFAAVSGSSAATAATIGRLTLPELARRGYDRGISLGSLAASGSLGMLIPPSIVMIVYGVSAEVSIARLFVAGVLPGLLLMGLFMGYIVAWSWLKKDASPPGGPSLSFIDRIRTSRALLPVVLLIVVVIGSIYIGLATPTEAAVVGVVGALVLSFFTGTLNRRTLYQSLVGATHTSCMIVFILAAAAFLSTAMGFTGLPREVGSLISEKNLSTYELILILTLLYFVMGCFLDGISMIVLTASVVLPAVEAANIDLLWFGIYVVIVVEMSQITPPVGFNLFVVQGLTGENILRVARASLPFFVMMMVAIVLITLFPEIVTFLPRTMTHG